MRVSGVHPDLSLVFPAAAPLKPWASVPPQGPEARPLRTNVHTNPDRSAAGTHPTPVLMCDLH